MLPYEGVEITQNFELFCGKCDNLFDATITAFVWRDGSVYGEWDCPDCGAITYSDNIANVADLQDHDTREDK
jgi:hypothetical protein